MLPCLVVLGNLVGLLGGLLVGVFYLDLSLSAYILRTQSVIGLTDWFSGLFKASVFGISIRFDRVPTWVLNKGRSGGSRCFDNFRGGFEFVRCWSVSMRSSH